MKSLKGTIVNWAWFNPLNKKISNNLETDPLKHMVSLE